MRKKTQAQGRALAVKVLDAMEQANWGEFPDVRKSREILRRGLLDFCNLGEKEKGRFVATLNEWIGTAMQGAVLSAENISDGKAEALSMRISTTDLNKLRRERESKRHTTA